MIDPHITVIIPTLATSERGVYLRRAVDSVVSQTGVNATVLLIANGCRCNEALLRELEDTKLVKVVRVAEGSLPNAIKIGRDCVETPFFCEVDDDDFLLPQGLYNLSRGFLQDPEAHAIIGNALIRREGFTDIHSINDIELLQDDPLGSLLHRNWLLSGTVLFRSDKCSAKDFTGIPKYLEWTYMAVLLCTKHKISFIRSAVAVHNLGYQFSIWESREARFGQIEALRTILRFPLPTSIKRGFHRKLSAAYHHCSVAYLDEGQLLLALTCHMKSLILVEGWRYLLYTRRLLSLPPTYRNSQD